MEKLASIQIDQYPASLTDFLAVRDQLAGNPAGAATALILALTLFVQEPQLGQPCLEAIIHPNRLAEGQLPRVTYQFIWEQLSQAPYIVRSYVQGTRPEQGYQLPAPPYQFNFFRNRLSDDWGPEHYKVFVHCTGADTPRPVTLRQTETGQWLALEWSTLIVGVREPETGA